MQYIAPGFLVNIGLCNGVLPEDTKPFPEPKIELLSVKSNGNFTTESWAMNQ